MPGITPRIERLEELIELLLGRGPAVIATASGTISALGVVTINHSTPNIVGITANIGANTLTVDFLAPFDITDGIYFAVAFIYLPGVGTSAFLPVTQTNNQTVFLGAYPGAGPWNFAIFAIANS